jgi:hypothetical protein
MCPEIHGTLPGQFKTEHRVVSLSDRQADQWNLVQSKFQLRFLLKKNHVWPSSEPAIIAKILFDASFAFNIMTALPIHSICQWQLLHRCSLSCSPFDFIESPAVTAELRFSGFLETSPPALSLTTSRRREKGSTEVRLVVVSAAAAKCFSAVTASKMRELGGESKTMFQPAMIAAMSGLAAASTSDKIVLNTRQPGCWRSFAPERSSRREESPYSPHMSFRLSADQQISRSVNQDIIAILPVNLTQCNGWQISNDSPVASDPFPKLFISELERHV